ncbi:MAG: signal peptide peptidase SppA [Pseudomarimonas sp.]
MTQPRPNFVVRFLRGIWDALNFGRRLILNLLFLLVVGIIVIGAFSGAPLLEKRTTLLIEPQGDIVEQYSVAPLDRAIARAQGSEVPEVLLRDLLRALQAAATDDRIERIALRTDGISYVGFAALHDLAKALAEVRAAGKQVIAYADAMDQKQYLLAAQADEVYLHPEGLVWLEGLSSYRAYYREALESKLGVNVHLFRVGEYKSAAETYILDAPSEAATQSTNFWMQDIWSRWLADVAAARNVDADELQARIDRSDEELAAVKGDAAELAIRWGLIDGLLNEDEAYDLLVERGSADSEGELVSTDLASYLGVLDASSNPLDARPQIAVVVAQGDILDGEQPPGTVGGPSTAELIRQTREDDDVKALVLRVDSPGGSAFASEQIRREIALTREAGKPVIASMANVAASGGYWISMNANEIWADPSTISGSIGIYGLLFTAPDTLKKLGVNVAGSGTTRLAGAFDLRKPLEPMLGRMVQSMIDKGYRDFIGKVAEARGSEPETIDIVARGRVWSGAQAKERGLVDSLGGLQDALGAAAKLAGLEEGEYQVTYIEEALSPFEQFIDSATRNPSTRVAVASIGWVSSPFGNLPLDARTRAQLAADLPWLLPPPPGARPFRGVVHCFCSL